MHNRTWPGALSALAVAVAWAAHCKAPEDALASADMPAVGTVTAISPMTTTRAAHTATLLRDGRVLITGGLDAGASVELFDPGTAAFVPAKPMRAARAAHTATLLADGRVLIAGGYNGSYLSSTEIYDPARGEFSPGPEMREARSGHLAITLRDGRILFVGGVTTGFTFTASAELFDPARNRFDATGPMSVPRESHVGALLPDGSVLVAGGHTGRRQDIRLYASAERYDPVRGVFSPTGSMARRRHKQAAVALADGRVLITGGSDERDDKGQYSDAEIYDPVTSRFTRIGEMQRSRYKHDGAMILLRDGNVLLAGGATTAEVFDPKQNLFALVPASAPLAGSFSAAVRLESGAVLITGGYGDGSGARANAWMYTPR